MRADAGRRDRVRSKVDDAPVAPLPEAAQIDRGQPIPEQVYRLLRQSIITMRLPPGATIIEKQITDQLAISRTPVRDALRQLADEGLVGIKPQSGTFVAPIDRHELEEGRLIRRALEALAQEVRLMLDDDVVAEAQDIDLCMIMGAGWPFHLGGITPYLDRSGVSERVTGYRFLPKGVASLPE